MNFDNYFLAQIFSKEQRPSLSLFSQALEVLNAGQPLQSLEFFQRFPTIAQMLCRYSSREINDQRNEIETSLVKGYWLMHPGHELYPRQFLTIEGGPFLLRALGSPIWLGREGLSVVGTREPSSPSLAWMEEHLSQFLEHSDSFTVSGGARGVDQKAHLLSIRHGQPTVAFLPSGLEQIYPSSLEQWKESLLDAGGAMISEYENKTSMDKSFFAQRNRLISAMGCATLVIEARRRSGTILTARQAIEQHRPLLILPGHPMDSHFDGSLDLLREGATPVMDAEDLIMIFRSEVQAMSYTQAQALRSLGLAQGLGHYS